MQSCRDLCAKTLTRRCQCCSQALLRIWTMCVAVPLPALAAPELCSAPTSTMRSRRHLQIRSDLYTSLQHFRKSCFAPGVLNGFYHYFAAVPHKISCIDSGSATLLSSGNATDRRSHAFLLSHITDPQFNNPSFEQLRLYRRVTTSEDTPQELISTPVQRFCSTIGKRECLGEDAQSQR